MISRLGAAAVLVLGLAATRAFAITIDGSPNDWLAATPYTDVTDPDESGISQQYDIQHYKELSENSTVYFYFDTYGYGAPATDAWFAIFVDADNDPSTGYPYSFDVPLGADIRLWWDPSPDTTTPPNVGLNAAKIEEWTGSAWSDTGRRADAAWGSDNNSDPATATFMFVEWAMPDTEITSPEGTFTWWAYYNNAATDADDIAPDTQDGVPGITPEPGTWALLLMGIGLVAGRARRRK